MSIDVAEHRAAVLWGDAILSGNQGQATAGDIAANWFGNPAWPAAYDGFHAATVVADDGRVTVGADVLGYYPVYYATPAAGDVLLVGASPEPFRWHPAFRTAVSLEGMLTVLLFGGPYLGRCLLEGVRRLARGRLLHWRPGETSREVFQYDPPTEHVHASLSLDDQIDALHGAYQRVVARHHSRSEAQGLLLSGGRDSRLLAGYLHAQGNRVEALTMGKASDHEVACATLVARSLGFTHHVADVSFDRDVEYATRCARWEHLAGGVATMHAWRTVEPSLALPSHTGNGYNRGREQPLLPDTFDTLMLSLTRRAVRLDLMRSLVRTAEARDIVDGLVEQFEACYMNLDDIPAERGWRLLMDSYARFYIGSVPWRLSFGSWPVMAELDREFLDTWIGIPIHVLANRGTVEAILTRHFRRLARLPLDRNAATTHPIAPSLRYRMAEWLSYRFGSRGARAGEPMDMERRAYYRQYDFDNPGWRAIRQAAEPQRAALDQWFDLDAVDRLLPAPQVLVNSTDPMTQYFAAKSLLGLMLWLRDSTTAPGLPST